MLLCPWSLAAFAATTCALVLPTTPDLLEAFSPASKSYAGIPAREHVSTPFSEPLDVPRAATGDDDDAPWKTPLPLVIWHGLGDNYAADGLADVAALADRVHAGTFVYMIRLDEDPSQDRSATFFGNLTTQLDQVCADIAAHPILSTAPAIDALGFSQGGQFLRGYVQRCNRPPVRSLVTFGSQHNGISEFQTCRPLDWVCKGAQGLLRSNTWSHVVQSRLVPAQYFRDPAQLPEYLAHSNFLADINNERVLKNRTYRDNLSSLERFVMYLFDDDETVIPKETGWFAEVNGTEVTPLRQRQMYTEDWLGLRTLDEQGRLRFERTKGGHMDLSEELLEDVFQAYFGPLGRVFDGEKPDARAGAVAASLPEPSPIFVEEL